MLFIALPMSAFAENVTLNTTSNTTVEADDTNISLEVESDIEVEVEENETETNETEVEEELTEEDALVLSDMTGAQVRLLQLEKRVDIQIDGATKIIEEIENSSNSTDVEKLKEIVEKFFAIKESIANTNFNQSADVLAKEFVALKKEAIELTKEFKFTARDLLTDTQKKEIKAEIKVRKEAKLKAEDVRLEKLKLKFNAKQAEKIMNRYGVSGEEIVAKVQSGNMSAEDVKEQIMNAMRAMDAQTKKEMLQRAKEVKIKERIKVNEGKERILERYELEKEDIEKRIESESKKFEFEKERSKRLYEMRKEFDKEREELREEERERLKELREDKEELRKEFEEKRRARFEDMRDSEDVESEEEEEIEETESEESDEDQE